MVKHTDWKSWTIMMISLTSGILEAQKLHLNYYDLVSTLVKILGNNYDTVPRKFSWKQDAYACT